MACDQCPHCQKVLADAVASLTDAELRRATEMFQGRYRTIAAYVLNYGSLVLGLLTDPDLPGRCFTVEMDVTSREWRAYTGGLVAWLKRDAPEYHRDRRTFTRAP